MTRDPTDTAIKIVGVKENKMILSVDDIVEIFKIDNDGSIYLRGKLIGKDKEVADIITKSLLNDRH